MFASFHPALLLAGRTARRQRLRAVVILATLAIPVAAVTAADVVTRSTHLTAAQQLDRELGPAQAVIDWVGYPVAQEPNPARGQTNVDHLPVGPQDVPGPARLPTSLLPAGADAVAEADTNPFLVSSTAGTYAAVRGVDLRAAAPAATVRLRSGRFPAAADEIGLSPPLASQLHARTGAVLHIPGSPIRLRVVGIVSDRYTPGRVVAFTLAATAERLQAAGDNTPGENGIDQWYVSARSGIPWRAVESFNRRGWTVTSRLVIDHPPAPGQILYDQLETPIPTRGTESGSVPGNGIVATATPDRTTPEIGAAVLGAMLLLEVALMAGPAFAVGARRRRQEMAVISATGGSRRQVVVFLAADGLLLGGVAAVAGTALGIGVGAAWLAVLRASTNRVPGSVSLRGWEIAGIALLALVSGLLAALFPAISASRHDKARVLRGRPARSHLSWRPAVAGALALAVSIGIALATLDEGSNGGVPVPLVVAAALAEIGFVFLTPGVLSLVGLLAAGLPLWPRLAVRDAARNRSSSAPAVAAIIAVVAAATAALIYGSSLSVHDRIAYLPSLPTGDAEAFLAPEPGVHIDAAAALAVVRAQLPAAPAVILDGQASGHETVLVVAPGCPAPEISSSNGYSITSGPSCERSLGLGNGLYLVDGGQAVATALGGATGRAAAIALRSGKAVVFNRDLLTNGRLTNSGLTNGGAVTLDIGPAHRTTTTVPAVAVSTPLPIPITSVILPPAMARRLHLQAQPTQIYVAGAGRQPAVRLQAADQALERLGIDGLYVQAPYDNGFTAALLGVVAVDLLLTIAATVAATALVTVDSLEDLLTLAALGAPPRGRRLLTMSRAAVIATIGSVGGVLAGLIPGIGLVWRLRHQYGGTESSLPGGAPFAYPLSVPWGHIVLIVIGAPVLAAGAAALVHRFTLPRQVRPARGREYPADPGLALPAR